MGRPELETPSGDERLKELLDELLDLPVREREERLAQATIDAPDLRRELEQLLSAFDGGPEDFLDPIEGPGLQAEREPGVPRWVGPYRVEALLGRGGMACVFRATQLQPIEREVAVKVVRPEVATPEILSRFEAERQVLARLDHPGIARVIDAGAEPYGPAYFVMDLVDGPPITHYARERRLSMSQRIELVIDVCEAVQHAHGRGILHRDLKPSNLLVPEVDGRPQPKVIDFGVAKALGRDGALAETELTRAGQLVGTLEYMSPEQAGLGCATVDVRADVFSMGVVLFELLTDRRPLDLVGGDLAALTEFVRQLDGQEPPAPSASPAPTAAIDLPAPAVDDLDCVVRHAMSRESDRRYPTMAALAEDLRSVLDRRPVSARPPTRSYLFARFAHRHRFLVGAGVALLLSLTLGIAGTTAGLVEASRRAASLNEALDESEQISRFLTDVLLLARSDRLGPDASLSAVIADATRMAEERDDLPPAVRGRLAVTLGAVLFDLEDRDRAEALFELATELLERANPTPAHRNDLLVGLFQSGLIAHDEGRFDLAQERYRRSIEVAEDLVDELGWEAERRLISVEANLASLIDERGDPMTAIPLQERAVERLAGREPKLEASMRSSLAITLIHAGDHLGAEREARRALAIREQYFPPSDFKIINPTRVLADAVAALGRTEEALALLDRVANESGMGTDDPRRTLLDLSRERLRHRLEPTAANAARFDAAAASALAVGGDSPRLRIRVATQQLEVDLGQDRPGSLDRARTALDALTTAIGADSADRAQAELSIGRALASSGRVEEARPFLISARDALAARWTARPPLADELDRLIEGP